MRKYKLKRKQVLDDIFCDICGVSCMSDCSMGDPMRAELATLEAVWGYCSEKDGDSYKCEMCEKCFNKVANFIDSLKAT